MDKVRPMIGVLMSTQQTPDLLWDAMVRELRRTEPDFED